MSEHDGAVEQCLQAYRDGDYARCAALARDLLDKRAASFVISQLLLISLQRSGREEEAASNGRWMVNALASKPWLKALIQVTLGSEPHDLRPPDDLARCQLLYYRGARCRTLGEDDRALDLFESASRQNVDTPERDLARHEANELAIVVDGETGGGWEEEEADLDEDDRSTYQTPAPAQGRGAGPDATTSRSVPPESPFDEPARAGARATLPPSAAPPVRSTRSRAPSVPPPAPPASIVPPPMPAAPAPIPGSAPISAPGPVPPARRAPTAEPAPVRTSTQPAVVRRHATVRYYRRLLPNRLYPLMVVLSVDRLRSLVQAELDQAATDGVVLKTEEPVVIEPILPGCTVYPPRAEVRIGTDEITQVDFRVLAVLQQGRLDGAAVVIRQGGVELVQIPLNVRVGKTTAAWALGVASMAMPAALQYFKLDPQTQAARSFAEYGMVVQQLLAAPWWAWTAAFVTAAAFALWWVWPRQETFWNIEVAASARSG